MKKIKVKGKIESIYKYKGAKWGAERLAKKLNLEIEWEKE